MTATDEECAAAEEKARVTATDEECAAAEENAQRLQLRSICQRSFGDNTMKVTLET